MALCSPQYASGPLADLGYVEEVCFGNIPDTPALKTVRRRSTTLALTKDSYSSDEVRSDRMISDSRHGIRRANGDIVTELSVGSHADFMEAVLGGVWVAPDPIALTSTAITPTINSAGELVLTLASGDDWEDLGFRSGDTLTFTGTGDALFDGKLFTLVGVAGSGLANVAVPYAGFPTSLGATTLNAGTASVKGGSVAMSNIYRSFTMERAFTDIGSFLVFTGCRINMMSVDLPPTGIATATYGIMGKNSAPLASASIDGVAEIALTDSTLTSLTFDAAAGTITAAAGDFVAAGIQAGDRVLIDGTGITDGQNRNPRTVLAVTTTVLTVAEAIQSGGPYSGPFTVTRVGLPDYALAPDGNVLVAVNGVLVKDGTPIATVTAMSFSIDNQMAGSEVVGANTIPANLFGNQCIVAGSMTVLFDRGGAGEDFYNAFDLEQDNIEIVMRLDSPDGTDAVTFTFPRCKINAGTIGDAVAEGLPVSIDFTALKPAAANVGSGTSQIVISDTSVAA